VLEGEYSKAIPDTRRSSSVPRVFKPAGCGSDFSSDRSPRSVVSTNASEKDILDTCLSFCSDTDYQDTSSSCSECPPSPSLSSAAEKSIEILSDHEEMQGGTKVTLSLSDMVNEGKKTRISLVECCASRSKLRSRAQPFQSAREPPQEVKDLISRAVHALRCPQDVMDVQVQSGGMGGTTMIIGEFVNALPDASLVFPWVKDAILNAALQSGSTYVMGYNVRPFNDLDSQSFSMNVACVPKAHKKSACWGCYENGICPRIGSCKWDHPTELDMMRVIVSLKQRDAM